MSYKLEYPYTEQERIDFISQYNHQQGLKIESIDNFVDVEFTYTEPDIDGEGETTRTEIKNVNRPTYYALEANEIIVNGVPQIDPDYEEKRKKEEREELNLLKLTKREVFLGLYQAKGVTPDQIKAQVTDPQALIEFEYANDYYRGNPLIDSVGAVLGITPEQLDCFFKSGGNPECLM